MGDDGWPESKAMMVLTVIIMSRQYNYFKMFPAYTVIPVSVPMGFSELSLGLLFFCKTSCNMPGSSAVTFFSEGLGPAQEGLSAGRAATLSPGPSKAKPSPYGMQAHRCRPLSPTVEPQSPQF